MKKEVENKKSFIRVLSCSESSGDGTEKAKPKIDKEELRKYLQNSVEEDKSTQKTSPKKTKKLVKKRKTSSSNTILQDKQTKLTEKPKKTLQKDSPQKYLLQGDDFKRLQKKAKKLGASSLDYSQRKNNKYMVEYDNKKIHFGSANSEDILNSQRSRSTRQVSHKSQENLKQRRSTYSPLTILSKLLVGQTFELKKKFKEIIFSLYKRMQLSSFENIAENDIVFHSAKKHKVPNSKIKYIKE